MTWPRPESGLRHSKFSGPGPCLHMTSPTYPTYIRCCSCPTSAYPVSQQRVSGLWTAPWSQRLSGPATVRASGTPNQAAMKLGTVSGSETTQARSATVMAGSRRGVGIRTRTARYAHTIQAALADVSWAPLIAALIAFGVDMVTPRAIIDFYFVAILLC